MLVPLLSTPSFHSYLSASKHLRNPWTHLDDSILGSVTIPHSMVLQMALHVPPSLDCSLVEGVALGSFRWTICLALWALVLKHQSQPPEHQPAQQNQNPPAYKTDPPKKTTWPSISEIRFGILMQPSSLGSPVTPSTILDLFQSQFLRCKMALMAVPASRVVVRIQ